MAPQDTQASVFYLLEMPCGGGYIGSVLGKPLKFVLLRLFCVFVFCYCCFFVVVVVVVFFFFPFFFTLFGLYKMNPKRNPLFFPNTDPRSQLSTRLDSEPLFGK